MQTRANWVLALGLVLGLGLLGYLLSSAALAVKQLERTVTVKGLSEREVPADVVIWPIQYSAASNDLNELYQTLERHNAAIERFLSQGGVAAEAISIAPPAIMDKSAQQYGGGEPAPFRFTAMQTVTVYSEQIEPVRALMARLSELGKQGLVILGNQYQGSTQYLFTGLNDLKPGMIEEATRQAREVALKFAADSDSQLGKIRRASQGQFSINDRDSSTPHIKKVRVVSTVEYYLTD
ncbi:SIMPL domain-containing protein [Ferrimonas marina]|uniref:SIMPL domain-containing protein n=1 Tax=Ferrimonas marina TaxID=299255 RepID=A0A1M5YTB7_9GAMM|nr:SIMPL domain-containing protein [Ferrimonas marina]SHI15281.1 hypothetical protein SAMN02745129_4414 [Ferrimonas marina]